MTKTIDDIYGEMLEVFAQESGYLPASSCDLAVRLYAAAAQIQSLLIQAQWVLDQSFPQTAQGEYLDRLAALRGISRSIATCATGNLRFGISSAIGGDLSIAAGTTCMTPDGIRFATTDNAVLSAGSLYVDVPAMALEPGKSGNVAAGTITIMRPCPPESGPAPIPSLSAAATTQRTIIPSASGYWTASSACPMAQTPPTMSRPPFPFPA